MSSLRPSRPFRSVLSALAIVAAVLAVEGCSSHRQARLSGPREAAQYASQARRDYRPPGPASDPWGPYIVEASQKYDVPERWIREVMRQESGGRLYENGELITSGAGAMGLMQVMPATYDELRARYDLGTDPYDPHDNIMAGTAYIRELYDVYGSPGFLAAYNAGPGRLDDYLTRNRPLPAETRNYVARISPYIMDSSPQKVSGASAYAMNRLPTRIPAGPRYPTPADGGAPVALADNRRSSGWSRGEVQTASLPAPPVPPPMAYPLPAQASSQAPPAFRPAVLASAAPLPQPPAPPAQMPFATAAASQPAPASRAAGGFSLIPKAYADTVPVRSNGPVTGAWAIQVGAFASESQARAAAESVRGRGGVLLASTRPYVGSVKQGRTVLYRARLNGLSRDAALQACERIGRTACIVVSPDAES